MIAKRPLAATLCVLLMLFLHPSFSAADPDSGQQDGATNKPRVVVTISEETTRITEPLREDGYVNYVAALNEIASKGVTLENNSAVLFWKAVGPSAIDQEYREEFFKPLGIAPLPDEGEYFVDVNDDACDQLEEVMKRPWSKREFPKLAKWLKANDVPLAIAVEATRRPKSFEPLYPEDSMLPATLLPGIEQRRVVARALCARGMLRLGRGNIDEAWADVLACHRLARLAGQGSTLINAALATNIERKACQADEAILQYKSLTAAQIAKIRADLKALGPMPEVADFIGVCDRYMYLDFVAAIGRAGVSWISILSSDRESRTTHEKLTDWAARQSVDWNLILRRGNSWYDRMEDAFHKPTYAERREAAREVEKDMRELVNQTKGKTPLSIVFLSPSCEIASERIGAMILGLLPPEPVLGMDAENHAKMRFTLIELSFALAAYRADNGSYPAKLADLMPKYVDKMPEDIFIEKRLKYERKNNGYLLYSVGPNGVDDNGRRREDCDGDKWDDIAVEVK